jgi:hypothetical protein
MFSSSPTHDFFLLGNRNDGIGGCAAVITKACFVLPAPFQLSLALNGDHRNPGRHGRLLPHILPDGQMEDSSIVLHPPEIRRLSMQPPSLLFDLQWNPHPLAIYLGAWRCYELTGAITKSIVVAVESISRRIQCHIIDDHRVPPQGRRYCSPSGLHFVAGLPSGQA